MIQSRCNCGCSGLTNDDMFELAGFNPTSLRRTNARSLLSQSGAFLGIAPVTGLCKVLPGWNEISEMRLENFPDFAKGQVILFLIKAVNFLAVPLWAQQYEQDSKFPSHSCATEFQVAGCKSDQYDQRHLCHSRETLERELCERGKLNCH